MNMIEDKVSNQPEAPIASSSAKPSYGGQAVIEGVMMKAPDGHMAMACRLPDGSITIEHIKRSLKYQAAFYRLPLVRGVVSFVDSLFTGTEVIGLSAQLAASGEEGEEEITSWQMLLAVVMAMVLGVGLFMVLPTVLLRLLPLDSWFGDFVLGKNLLESVVRMAIFLSYVVLISQMKDIRRVFEYHGAEHKTIHCYEAGLPLTPENAQGFSALHPRCGTSFLLIVMVISSLFFSLFGWPDLLTRIVSRLLLLPLVAGFSYEVLRWMSKYQGKSIFIDAMIWPGLQLQRLTTRQPDLAQLEVAIASLHAAQTYERAQGAADEDTPS